MFKIKLCAIWYQMTKAQAVEQDCRESSPIQHDCHMTFLCSGRGLSGHNSVYIFQCLNELCIHMSDVYINWSLYCRC